jgi:hypothetical protein
MEKLDLTKEIRKKASALGLPLTCVLEAVSISRSSYENWALGFFSPSKKNKEKLEDALTLLEIFSSMKKKRDGNAN